MNKEIRAVLIGAGKTGLTILRFLLEKGITIVGAADLYSNVGKDVGEAAGLKTLNVLVETDVDAMLKRTKPDVAVVCTASEMEKIYPIYKLCVENSVNVISVAEEAFYPYYTAPELARELDRLAKDHGVRILGTGVQDVFWYSWCMSTASIVHNIREIHGDCLALVDDFGAATADEVFAGATLEEYQRAQEENQGRKPRAFTVGLHNLADALGLHVEETKYFSHPVLAPYDIYSEKLDREVKKGCLVGVDDGATLETKEGISLTGVIHDRIRIRPEEVETTSWKIVGEPDMEVSTNNTNGIMTGMIGLVNRIPDLLNAEPGFRLVKDLPHPSYHVRPLPEYWDRAAE